MSVGANIFSSFIGSAVTDQEIHTIIEGTTAEEFNNSFDDVNNIFGGKFLDIISDFVTNGPTPGIINEDNSCHVSNRYTRSIMNKCSIENNTLRKSLVGREFKTKENVILAHYGFENCWISRFVSNPFSLGKEFLLPMKETFIIEVKTPIKFVVTDVLSDLNDASIIILAKILSDIPYEDIGVVFCDRGTEHFSVKILGVSNISDIRGKYLNNPDLCGIFNNESKNFTLNTDGVTVIIDHSLMGLCIPQIDGKVDYNSPIIKDCSILI